MRFGNIDIKKVFGTPGSVVKSIVRPLPTKRPGGG